MNRARQDAITTEIMEIVGGAEALSAEPGAATRTSSPTTSPAPRPDLDSADARRTDRRRRTEHRPQETTPMTVTDTQHRAPSCKDGRVVAIAGPVVDVEFPRGCAARDQHRASRSTITIDGDDHASITGRGRPADRRQPRSGPSACKPTDGLTRGAAGAQHSAAASQMPVGDAVLGHVFNVIGEPLDTDARSRASTSAGTSTATPPPSTPSSPRPLVFETGIKVIDLLTPYLQGGKIGLFGGAGVGKTVLIHRDDQPGRHPARWRVGVRRRRRAHP